MAASLWLRLTRVYPPLPGDPAAAGGWELYKAHHGIGFYAGPCSRCGSGKGCLRSAHPHPRRGAAKQPVAAAGGDRSRIDLEPPPGRSAWSGLAICCFHCSFPSPSPAAAGATSPLCWPDGAGLYRAQSRVPWMSPAGAGHRARVRNSCSASGCCPGEGCRQWSMMQQDLCRCCSPLLPSR